MATIEKLDKVPGTLALGDKEAPPLVLLHGVGDSSESWRALMEGLAGSHRVIALTFPGHVGGPTSQSPESIGSLVRFVRTSLKELGIKEAHLAGVSLGGWVALEAARAAEQDSEWPTVLSVTAIGPGGAVNRESLRVANSRIQAIRKFAEQNMSSLNDVAKDPAMRKGFLSLIAQHGDRLAEEPFKEFVERQLNTDKKVYLDLLAVPEDPFKKLVTKCPITLLWGVDDLFLPLAVNEEQVKKNVPKGVLIEVPDSGHVTQLDNPVRTVREILRTTARGAKS